MCIFVNMEEQWHVRATDDELILGVRHEMARSGSTRTAEIMAILRDGLVYRRIKRDWERTQVYQAEHEMVYGEQDVVGSTHTRDEEAVVDSGT